MDANTAAKPNVTTTTERYGIGTDWSPPLGGCDTKSVPTATERQEAQEPVEDLLAWMDAHTPAWVQGVFEQLSMDAMENAVLAEPVWEKIVWAEGDLCETYLAECLAELEQAEAQADQEIRESVKAKGEKLTETAIAALLPLHSKVVAAKATVRVAKQRSRRAQAAVEIVKAYGRAIDRLIRLRELGPQRTTLPGSPLYAAATQTTATGIPPGITFNGRPYSTDPEKQS